LLLFSCWTSPLGSVAYADLVWAAAIGRAFGTAIFRVKAARPEKLPAWLDRDAANGETHLAYVEQCPVPKLKRNDIVVMDNLTAHKVVDVEEVIGAAGAFLRYLPEYSSDLNVIEMLFHKWKAFLLRFPNKQFQVCTVDRLIRSHFRSKHL
jgi:transposase